MTYGDRAVRVVLMQPPLRTVVGAATPAYVDRNRGHMPPMGLLYLVAAVQRHGRHEPIFLDADLEGWDHDEAARHALSHGPHLVALHATTFTLPDAVRVAAAIKRLDPAVTTLLGGPHATLFPRQTAALDAVDFAFEGEAEVGLPRFLDVFCEKRARAAVPGIAATLDGTVVYTPAAALIADIDTLPLPARHASPYRRYSSVLARRNPITVMLTSRGCPFGCVFCNRMGRTYRGHSPDHVLREIESIVDLGIHEIFIHDDLFTLQRPRVEAICRGIVERGLNVRWMARSRADCVDGPLLSLMRRAGCRRLSFGVESGSERVLRSMGKPIQIGDTEAAFRLCRGAGIRTLADIMFGNPDEEIDDVQRTLELVSRLDPDYAQFNICSPYPGTPLYDLARRQGLISRDVWLDFARDPLAEFDSPVWTQHFSRPQLESMTASAYRRFYFRPGFVLRQLRRPPGLSQAVHMARAAVALLRRGTGANPLAGHGAMPSTGHGADA